MQGFGFPEKGHSIGSSPRVPKEFTFLRDRLPGETWPIAGASTIASSTDSTTTWLRSNGHNFLEKEVVFKSLYLLAAAAAGNGHPKGGQRFGNSSVGREAVGEKDGFQRAMTFGAVWCA